MFAVSSQQFNADLPFAGRFSFPCIGKLLLCVLLLVMAFPAAAAGCSRDDVDYYLEKGFSRSQITTICGARLRGEKLPVKIVPPARNEPKNYRDLRNLLLADVVKVDPKSFSFVDEVCVRKNTCPQIFYQVYFRGLKVTDVGWGYGFFTSEGIKARGKIKRKVLTDFSDMSEAARARLKKRLLSVVPANEALIRVRNKEDRKHVTQILRVLAKRAGS